jgi:hypothetical protein
LEKPYSPTAPALCTSRPRAPASRSSATGPSSVRAHRLTGFGVSRRGPGARKTYRGRAGSSQFVPTAFDATQSSPTSGLDVHQRGGRCLTEQEGLGLSERTWAILRDVFRNFGNMSSATVLFVLEQVMTSAPATWDLAVMAAMAPAAARRLLAGSMIFARSTGRALSTWTRRTWILGSSASRSVTSDV